jgi:lipoprotein-anchoring transpeptidase ErfK/SrfK
MVGNETLIATAKGASVPVFSDQGAKEPSTQLSNPNEDGAPRVFLIKARRGDWLQVLLPVRPNGSKGWIRVSDVTISSTLYRVRVELGAHRITVVRGRDLMAQEPVGIGKANTPTPGGEYYITELVEPPNPNGAYGPYAYGLSGYSDVLKEFQGGNGVVGIHGTNEPGLLGSDVSFGCIRMSNAGITKLAALLPLGTPVDIVA